MQQFLSSILKNNKITTFIILCGLVCSGLLYTSYNVMAQDETPQTFNVAPAGSAPIMITTTPATFTAAQQATTAAGQCTNTDWHCTDFNYHETLTAPDGAVTNNYGSVCVDQQVPDGAGNAVFGWAEPGRAILAGASRSILYGGYLIASYSSYILDYVVTVIMNKAITTDKNFTEAWTQVRNLANMIIVLGFVIVGIATALRIKTYEANKLLFPLIAVAILVNFSGLLCGIIIDASNITTKGLMGNGSNNMGEVVIVNMVGVSHTSLNVTDALKNTGKFAGECILWTFVYLGTAFTFFYLGVLLIARYIVLIMLFVLSPLAFAFWIYPATRHLWTEWWNNFLKWAFVGMLGSFVLWLVTPLISAIKPGMCFIDLLIQITIVLGFLYIGFKMTSKKTGIASMAAGAVMGVAKGAAGLAVGLGVGGAKIAGGIIDKGTGGHVSGAAQRISSKVGGFAERIGIREVGTTAAKSQAQLKEAGGRIANLGAAEKTKMAMGMGMGATEQNRTAAVMDLVKNGDLSSLGSHEDQARAVTRAENYMKNRGMGSTDTEGKSSLKKAALMQNPNIGTPEELKSTIAKQTPKELAKNLDAKSMSPQVLAAMNTGQIEYMASEAAPQLKRTALSDQTRTPTGRAAVKKYIRTLDSAQNGPQREGAQAAREIFANNFNMAKALTEPEVPVAPTLTPVQNLQRTLGG